MFYRYLSFTISLLFLQGLAIAQQFVGFAAKDYAAIQQVPYNPAWVTRASTGTEIGLVGVSVVAGTNAYIISRKYITSGLGTKANENTDLIKDLRNNRKHAWGNADVLGPSFSYNFKGMHNIGVYTRAREITRGGNIDRTEFQLIGKMLPEYYNQQLNFDHTGFSTHSFAEIGFTYGRELMNDYSNIWHGGVTIKYLMGFSAASVYTPSMHYVQSNKDSLASVQGDITAVFTYNLNPVDGPVARIDPAGLTQRAGRGSLGMDIGVQYEYHDNPNPNEESKYVYSIAASITDIGGINYLTDTGSGSYRLNVIKERIESFNVQEGEYVSDYVARLIKDSLLVRTDNIKKFRVGLPTAFRLNGDYNITPTFNLAANIMLNLRGSHDDIFKPAYVSYFNITPTFGRKNFKVSIPFTFVGYQTVVLGAVLQSGPFYIGTNSLFSTLLSKNLKNADMFLGLMFKLHKKRTNYYTY